MYELLPCDAVRVTGTEPETGFVLMVKVHMDDPAGTVAVAGTEAEVLPEDRLTTIPPVGA